VSSLPLSLVGDPPCSPPRTRLHSLPRDLVRSLLCTLLVSPPAGRPCSQRGSLPRRPVPSRRGSPARNQAPARLDSRPMHQPFAPAALLSEHLCLRRT
jgi:hypothetical protein